MAAEVRAVRAPGFTPKRIMIVAAAFVMLYFGLSIASNAVTRTRLADEQRAIEAEVRIRERRFEQLQALHGYMKSDAFIEAAARDMGLVYPGEIAVIPVYGDGAEPPSALNEGEEWWMRYIPAEDRR